MLDSPVDPPNPKTKFDQYCGNEVYVKINDLYSRTPNIQQKRQSVLKSIEKGNSDLSRFAKDMSLRVLEENELKTCWSLKVRYSLLNFESDMVAGEDLGENVRGLEKERYNSLRNSRKK